MTVLGAFVYYIVRLAIFGIVICAGVAIGIKFRKKKDTKKGLSENE